MTRFQIIRSQDTNPDAHEILSPPRRFWRLKAALATGLMASAVVGFVLAALLLGSIIAALLVIVVVIVSMVVECLLLTGDSCLLGAIRAKFSERGIELLVRKDAASAIELSKRRHLDGFVIDCDEVPQGKESLRSIPANPANKRSVMLAIVSGRSSVSQACELGANI